MPCTADSRIGALLEIEIDASKQNKNMNYREFFEKGISYVKYMQEFELAVAEKRTSGPNQDEMYVRYTMLNLHRSNRLYKHTEILAELSSVIDAYTKKLNVLILSEFWCGDAAQNLPVIAKALSISENIEIRILFRDENLELMDQFLTNGGRSIPKVILLDGDFNVVGSWGPRPALAQEEMARLKAENSDFEVIIEGIQKWYNNDKSLSLQKELSLIHI